MVVEINMAYKKRLSVASQNTVAIANRGNLNQAIASPNEYNGISESDAEIKQTNRKAKHIFTQKTLSQENSFFTIERMTNDNAISISHPSAGERSIKRKNGPKSQNI